MEIRWIKLSTDLFDNRKIRQIESLPDGDALIVIWLKLLILAGDTNDGGYVYFTKDIPYTDQLLATQFGRPLATVQLAIKTFAAFGMIEIIDDLIHVSNWEKYQNIEGMEKVREQNRIRKQMQRAREKALPPECHVTSRDGHATEKEIDKEIDKNKEREYKEKETAKRFTAPTIEQIKAYCQERGNSVDPERFFNYYSANGWKVGKNTMKDFKAAIRLWERNGYDKKKDAIIENSDPADTYERAIERTMEKIKEELGYDMCGDVE